MTVKIAYQLYWINPRLVNPMWEPENVLLGRGDEESINLANIPDFPQMPMKALDPLLNQIFQSNHYFVI